MELEINNQKIIVRDDGYVNVTKLCKAAGKLFKNWFQLKSSKELIEVFQFEMQTDKPILELGTYNSCSWAHLILSVEIGRWCSYKIGFQLSKLYARFNLGDQTLHKEIDQNKQNIEQQKLINPETKRMIEQYESQLNFAQDKFDMVLIENHHLREQQESRINMYYRFSTTVCEAIAEKIADDKLLVETIDHCNKMIKDKYLQ